MAQYYSSAIVVLSIEVKINTSLDFKKIINDLDHSESKKCFKLFDSAVPKLCTAVS